MSVPSSYITLGQNDSCFAFTSSNSDNWFKFTAPLSALEFDLSNTTSSGFDSVAFWKSTGGDITFVNSGVKTGDENTLVDTALSTDSIYWIYVRKVGTVSCTANNCISFKSSFMVVFCGTGCPSVLYDSTNTCELVCNGGFEYNYFNPTTLNKLLYACPWQRPAFTGTIISTPDYFSSDGGTPVDIPSNNFGWQNSYTSNSALSDSGYAGILCYWGGDSNNPADPDYREYVSEPLISNLLAGKQYKISFRVSLADKAQWGSKNLGAYLSSGILTQNNANFINVIPQVVNSSFITDTMNWVLISGTYTATGTESWITIGQFTSDAGSVTHFQTTGVNGSYYYIDDVRIEPYPDSIFVSVTPNPVCNGDTVRLIAQTNVANAYFFTWLADPIATGGLLTNNNDTVYALPGDTEIYKSIIHLPNYYGCTINDTTKLIWLPGPKNVNAGTNQTICLGKSATLMGTLQGTYNTTSWATMNNQIICTNCTTTVVNPSMTTQYIFTATNTVTGCSDTDRVWIIVNPLHPSIILPVGGATTCAGCLNFTTSQSYSAYSWSANTSNSCDTCSTFQVCYPQNFNQVSAPVSVSVTDSNGCMGNATIYVPPCCVYKGYLDSTISNDSTSHLLISHPGLLVFNVVNQSWDAVNRNFSINGVLVIDQKTRFIGCDIWMGPNAKIIIRSGISFELTKQGNSVHPTRLYDGLCGEMWDGIYVDGTNPLSELKVNKGTTIEDAMNAIVSTHGGKFTVDGSSGQVKLNKNYIAILIHPYNGTHPGTIRNTIISCDKNGQSGATVGVSNNSAFLDSPFSASVGYAGIVIDTVTNFTIGDSTLYSYRNLFERTTFGVYAVRSNTNVWNNDFRYFTAPTLAHVAPIGGIAVYATNTSFGTSTNKLTVGRAGTKKAANIFKWSSYGVEATAGMNLSCERNRFDSCYVISIYSLADYNRTILVNLDTLHDCTGTNISCVQTNNSTITISNNVINETANLIASNFGQTGIYCANAMVATTHLAIQNNSIKKMRNGIWVSRVNNAKITDNGPITFIAGQPYSVALPATGIHIDQCVNAKVRNNRIKNTGAAVNTNNTIYGIYIENCKNDTITQDSCINVGSGIFLKGSDNPSLLACNKLKNCFYGINFGRVGIIDNPVSLNDQILFGTSQIPTSTGNVWTASIQTDLGGKIQQINGNGIHWYYNPTSPTFGQVVLGSFYNSNTSVGGVDQCSSFLAPAPVGNIALRDYLLSGICKNPRTYDTLSDAYIYDAQVFAYRMLHDNPAWLSLGTSDDVYYQNFMNTMFKSNIEYLAYAEDAIAAEDYSTADAYVAAVQSYDPQTLSIFDRNRATVMRVFLNTWANDDFNLSDADQGTLYNIAKQGMISGGMGVTDARNMLEIEIHDSSNVRVAYQPIENSQEIAVSHVFPNPTTGKFSFNLDLPDGQDGQMNLYDLTGRRVAAWQLVGGIRTYTFDASNLPSGTYIYSVICNGVAISTGRLVIIRQE
ncbi:MAG: T9SS type A sorting domain-containing protein [Bacteroidetes bacterium]|nr:T9SS type A sorting domain-containing protein [Bacteroidota bacterium]